MIAILDQNGMCWLYASTMKTLLKWLKYIDDGIYIMIHVYMSTYNIWLNSYIRYNITYDKKAYA